MLNSKKIEHEDLVTGEKALEYNKLCFGREFMTLSLIAYLRLKIMNNLTFSRINPVKDYAT